MALVQNLELQSHKIINISFGVMLYMVSCDHCVEFEMRIGSWSVTHQ